jgi:hypothetical protein
MSSHKVVCMEACPKMVDDMFILWQKETIQEECANWRKHTVHLDIVRNQSSQIVKMLGTRNWCFPEICTASRPVNFTCINLWLCVILNKQILQQEYTFKLITAELTWGVIDPESLLKIDEACFYPNSHVSMQNIQFGVIKILMPFYKYNFTVNVEVQYAVIIWWFIAPILFK